MRLYLLQDARMFLSDVLVIDGSLVLQSQGLSRHTLLLCAQERYLEETCI